MRRLGHLPVTVAGLAATFSFSAASAAPPDVITVTGSRLGAPATGANTLDRETLERSGAEDLTQALVPLPQNVGGEFNSDSGTQNDTSGTAQANLRGLGLDATLVLLDGARMTVSNTAADDGASFVDLNALVPAIAIARVDVFADGASAVHGSDALAGVIDVATRRGFTGLETEVERRVLTEYGADGSDWRLGAIWGRSAETWRLAAAASWLDRRSLEGTDVDFVAGTGLSNLGQPGGYRVALPGGGFSGVIQDPDCAAAGGLPLTTGAPVAGLGTPGFCRLDFAQFFSVVNNETRLQGWLDGEVRFGDVRAYGQVVGASNRIERGNSPSLPNLDFPTLPANNPGNLYGVPVIWFGRPLGSAAGSARRDFTHDTWRALGGLEGPSAFAGRTWTWTLEGAYSRNDATTTITDTLKDRFTAAVAGFGGPDCPADAAAQGIAPGDRSAGCYFFNPFGSGVLVTDPDDPRFNDPAVVDWFIGENVRKGWSDLLTVEARAETADLFEGPGGPVAAVLGIQARRTATAVDHGEDFNAEAFGFIIGGPDYAGDQIAGAVFGEARVPLARSLEAQLAARIETEAGETALAPRLGLAWTPAPDLTVTASAARAFRAPSVFERVSSTTTLESFPINGVNVFRAVLTQGSETLAPETATTFAAGADYTPGPARLSLAAWAVEAEDLIVEENAQAIVAADLADNGAFNDPRIELAPNGEVRRVRAGFVNAPSVEAWGIDAGAGLDLSALGGDLGLAGAASWIGGWELTDPVTGAVVDAKGSRNFRNFARSLPEWRATADAAYARGPVEVGAGVRFIGAYADDEAGRPVEAWTALDLRAALDLGASTLTLGAENVGNEDPPFVQTPLGYDTKLHDPRGRIVYLRLGTAW